MHEPQNHTAFRSSVPYLPPGYSQQPELDSLTRELESIAALPRSTAPELVGLCRRTLVALGRIQHAATLADVSDTVAHHLRLAPDDLAAKSRTQRIAFARQLAMYLCRKIAGAPFESIGEHFKRDHSTVIYAYQLIERRMARDAAFRLFIAELEGQITRTMPTTAAATA